MESLLKKKCVPCEGGVPALKPKEWKPLLKQTKGWKVVDGKLSKKFVFKNFPAAMRFVNAMAAVAESEGHHPDFSVHFNKVFVWVWTHAIEGLSQNDFILAAKINRL